MKAIVMLLAVVLCCGSVDAAMPQTLNYQGYLTNSGGTPVNSAVVMTLKLYDAATAGNLKWSEIQPSVTVTNGIFGVVLGSVNPIPPLPFDAPYFLSVTINADPEMSPRQPVTASAYAIRAANADALAPAATVAGSQITGAISTATLPVANLAGTIGTTQIASNAVTQAKLSPVSGAAAGKVLGTDGSNLQWVTAGAGSVTSVGTGSGLTGGPITGSGTINLAATQLLPAASCATNQIAKWNGSAWACAADDNAPAGGTTGQVLAGTAGAPAWTGSPTLSGNLILPGTGGAGAGTIMKAGTRFMHYTGFSNTFIGEGAGNFTMSGGNNTGSGVQALLSNTSGTYNTANGSNVLYSNTTGAANTAIGSSALQNNTTGINNTASGANALLSNMTGSGNTAYGLGALQNSGKIATAGSFVVGVTYTIQTVGTTNFTLIGAANNTVGTTFNATGVGAGTGTASPNTPNNTANGYNALFTNTTGDSNVGTGYQALLSNTTGSNNVANGFGALGNNTSGTGNVGVGGATLVNNSTGSANIAIGVAAGLNLTTGNWNIDISNVGVAGESNTIRIGTAANQSRTFVSGIYGAAIGGSALAVSIDSNGQLGTPASSRRYKDDITDMDAASSALTKLRPVTFHYKSDKNTAGRTLQYGLIAEEVNQVYPGLVAYSADGRIETVMYQFLPPMLLNEFQKQQRTIAAQALELSKQAAAIDKQTERIAGLEKQASELAMLKQQMAELQATVLAAGRGEAARLAAAQ